MNYSSRAVHSAGWAGTLFIGLLLAGFGASGEEQERPAAKEKAAPTPELKASEFAEALGDTFAAIARKVSPAVVVINVWYPEDSRQDDGHGDEASPEFFFPQPHRPGPSQRGRPEGAMPQSQGSGFIVDKQGYIYTNNHVIDRAERIEVKLKDGEKVPAEVIGVDPNSDVAVIKINPKSVKSELAVAELADSDRVRVGEWAIAIGAPFRLEYSVTVGVVSGKGRTGFSMDASRPVYEDYIQTDATINPGNSGGPLVDIRGRVIGINTLIRTSPGATGFYNTNTGFAIPINMADENARQIIKQGRVIRPWLGIKIQSVEMLSPEIRRRLKGVSVGVVIQGIDPETPASKSDLKPFDVVVEIDGSRVDSSKQLQQEVLGKKVGQLVKLAVIRNGAHLTVEVKTGELPTQVARTEASTPPEPPREKASTRFGLTVQPLSEALARRFRVRPGNGLLISAIDPGSPAADAGLWPGDIITEVDYTSVRSIGELKTALERSDPDRGALIHFLRQGNQLFAVLIKNRTGTPE